MTEINTKIKEIIKRTHDVKSFRMGAEEEISFQAGQFFLFTINIKGEDTSKYFSFSNSPTEKGYIEFTKRITNSTFSQFMDKVEVNTSVRIKMPLGSFTLKDENEKIAFLSGGIGITPIRSICKYATDKALKTNIVLLYGNRSEKDIVFREDFEEMQRKNNNLKVVHTLISPENINEKWQGRVSYIDEKMIKEGVPDYSERVFYICGPPKMVETLKKTLEDNLNVPKERIRLENFAGY